MNKRRILPGLVMFLFAYGVARADIFLPPAGDDEFPGAKATLTLSVSGTPSLQCAGVMRVHRSDPVGSTVPTEMTALDLVCAPSNGASNVRISLNPAKGSSIGQISSTGASFFDVFLQITGLPQGTLHNEVPMRIQANTTHITPFGAQFANIDQISMVDNGFVAVGLINNFLRPIGFQVKTETSGEFSPVFSCFYECKTNRFSPLYWREVTSLMLINQSATATLWAHLFFIDGNENPVRQALTSLSPLDLDEVNVCETLNLAGVPVPQAGVVEVVLTGGAPFGPPTGGAYGWVKDVVGAFVRGNPEPFAGFPSGVGKTQCRIVGTNVVNPANLLQRMAGVPTVQPVLIEGTNP